jgi:hypothetical protein
MATPIVVGAYKAPWALLMLVTSAIERQAWEHGKMWHVAGGWMFVQIYFELHF